jgi:hypothetical protein
METDYDFELGKVLYETFYLTHQPILVTSKRVYNMFLNAIKYYEDKISSNIK